MAEEQIVLLPDVDLNEETVESTYIILPNDDTNLLASQDGLQWGSNVMLTLEDEGGQNGGNKRIIKIIMAQAPEEESTTIMEMPPETEGAEVKRKITLVVDDAVLKTEQELVEEIKPAQGSEELKESVVSVKEENQADVDAVTEDTVEINDVLLTPTSQSKRRAVDSPVSSPPKRSKRIMTRSKSRKKNPDVNNSESETFFCDICDKEFMSDVGLRSHMIFHTSLKCKGCKKVFESAEKRIVHQNKCKEIVKPDERRFTCEICAKSFKTKSHLENHANIHADVKPYMCQMCGQGFNQVSNLNYHINFMHETDDHGNQVSQNTDKFSCDICGKNLRSTAALDYHRLIHTKSKPFQCPHCRYAARSKSTLDDHIYNLHLKRNYAYPCKHCRTGFSDANDLQEHMENKHAGVDVSKKSVPIHIFQCDLCKKEVFRKSSLANHLLKEHSHQLEGDWWSSRGLKLYKCELCGKVMTSSTGLVQHEKHQHLEPQFSCGSCGKKFSRKYNLEVHERTHSGEKPYSCPTCSASFSDPANLIHHYKKQGGQCRGAKKRITVNL